MSVIELRAAISLAFVYVMRMLGLFMVIPVIAIAARDYPDYSALWVGLAIGGYGLTQAILQIPMGMASDKFGRKPVIYVGLTLFIAGSIVAAMADTMATLTLGRILQGMGAIAGAVMALAADVTRESQRTKIMAIIGVSIGFSFYLALLFGPMFAANIGLNGIFIVTAVGATLCLPIIKWGVITPSTLAPSGDALPTSQGLKRLIKDSQLLRLNTSVLLIHLLITSFFVQVPMLLSKANFDLDQHWKIYTPILILSVVFLLGLMRLSSFIARTRVFMFSLALMGLGFFIFINMATGAVGLSWMLITLAGILFFAGFNYLEANMPAMVSSLAPVGQKGSAMGLYASFQFFGAFLGGIATGILNQYFQPLHVYLFCLFIIILLGVIISGSDSVQKIKRFTVSIPISVDLSASLQITQLLTKLREVPGVIDLDIDQDQRAVYLKTSPEFDLEQVNQVLSFNNDVS